MVLLHGQSCRFEAPEKPHKSRLRPNPHLQLAGPDRLSRRRLYLEGPGRRRLRQAPQLKRKSLYRQIKRFPLTFID